VSDGTRTRGRRDHNPELYQLSYAHQANPQSSGGERENGDAGFELARKPAELPATP
jgi:hypothetical protein